MNINNKCRTCLAGIDEDVLVCMCIDSYYIKCLECCLLMDLIKWRKKNIDAWLCGSLADDELKQRNITEHKRKIRHKRMEWERHIDIFHSQPLTTKRKVEEEETLYWK